MKIKPFDLLGVLTLLIFLPLIVFSCGPCSFGEGDPGPDKDTPILRQGSSVRSGMKKYIHYL